MYNTVRYFIELSYLGKDFHGWQRQPNASTVQETLENALTTILRKPIQITGAGRTDTGVHASQMYAHFDWEIEEGGSAFAKAYLTTLTDKLNAFLPQSIAIARIFEVSRESHARFDAISRSYLYRIAKTKNPFTPDLAYRCRFDLDLAAMNAAAERLLHHTDFACFSKSNTAVKTHLCEVTEARWEETEDEYIFYITANRFLRNMVRAIVGTLLEIGRKKQPVSWMDEVIASRDRSQAGTSVPGHGLYLTHIAYPKQIKTNGKH